MHSIASLTPKSSPPPSHPQSHHHAQSQYRRHHDMFAIRRDINPATYYDRTSTPRTPRSPVNASSSSSNLLSTHSANNKNGRIQSDAQKRSSTCMDLFSYAEQNTHAQQSCFSDILNEHSNYEFNNPSGSWSDLYSAVEAKNMKSNKKQYKNQKIKSNIVTYMQYMALNTDTCMSDGGCADREGTDCEPDFEPQSLPPQTTFDSVDDIFNLIGNHNQPKPRITRMPVPILDEMKEPSRSDTEAETSTHDNEGSPEVTPTGQTEEARPDEIYEKQVYRRLRQILNEHDMAINLSGSDNDALFTNIDHLCQDLNVKQSKVEHIQQKHTDLQSFLSRLKTENEALKRKNNELANQLTLTSVTTEDVLAQLNDYLTELKYNLSDSTSKSINALFTDFKQNLKSTQESLRDLANDLNSETLQLVVTKVNKSVIDLEFLEHHNLYRKSSLQNIINDLLKDLNVTTPRGTTPNGFTDDGHKYSEFVFDEKDSELKEEPLKKENKLTKYGVFDDDFPTVLRIEIYGGWFNKKSRAVIKYKGQTFYRKEADFKWLYKMIQVGNGMNKVIPDLPKELPHVLWPNNYLSKRSSELNLFLMQCHSLRNVKDTNPWNIFLIEDKKTWKEERDVFDKEMLKKIKQNQV